MHHSRAFRPHDGAWSSGRRQKLGILLGVKKLGAATGLPRELFGGVTARREIVDGRTPGLEMEMK